jgi:hypothetical protein
VIAFCRTFRKRVPFAMQGSVTLKKSKYIFTGREHCFAVMNNKGSLYALML